MALDGLFIHSLIKELNDTIINCKIDKVNQPEKDEIILTIRGNRTNNKLLISCSSSYPRIHFTKINKINPKTPPMFCMVLRKYISNSKIINIQQIDTDRILLLDLQKSDELGFDTIYSLVIEIMGRHSNITLIRKKDNIIIDSIKHITADVNRFRSIYPGLNYIYPPKSTKLNPFNFSYDEFKNYVNINKIPLNKKLFSNSFTGICSNFSNELYTRVLENSSLSEMNFENAFDTINKIFNDLKNNKFKFLSYSTSDNTLKDFYCFDLKNLDKLTAKEYSTPSLLLEDFYCKKDLSDRLNNKSSNLQKLLHNNIDRCEKKIHVLKNVLKECNSKEKFRLYGELLTANIYLIKKGDTKISVCNYYSENNESLTIKLNENKTPSENIQSYYKKYNKLKKSEEASINQLELAKEELDYLQSVLTNIINCENYKEIDEIKQELIDTGYIRLKKNKKSKDKPLKPLHFVSSDGLDIYVGKNNFQNDYLTLKFANKHDIWMHTKNIPGSHVIIKNFDGVPEKTLEEAAALAAYYSKAKESSKVPVDYTEVKNVKKPSGAKPGRVIYTTNKTIYCDPYKLDETK